MSEWQPIETAPRDGTEIFVTAPNWGVALKARWIEYPGNPVLDESENDCWMVGWAFDDGYCLGHEHGWLGWNDDPMPSLWIAAPTKRNER